MLMINSSPASASASSATTVWWFALPSRAGGEMLPHRPQQHRVPVKVEKSPLTLCESANVDDALRLDVHALERGPVRHWAGR